MDRLEKDRLLASALKLQRWELEVESFVRYIAALIKLLCDYRSKQTGFISTNNGTILRFIL